MAVQIERLEPGIIYLHYDKHMTMQDVVEASSGSSQAARAAGDERFVSINHFEPGVRIPFDLHNLKQIVSDIDHPIGAIVIDAPLMTQLLGRMIDRLTPLRVIEAQDLDEAVVLARRLLAAEPA